MPETVAALSDSRSYIIDDYVRLLFEQFKDSPFERNLVMAFARHHDLAQTMLNNALPGGQKYFTEDDVRALLARFDKQAMQQDLSTAKNAIIATGQPALALGDYELAWHNLLREFSRYAGETPQQETSMPTETVSLQSDTSTPPPPRTPQVQEVQGSLLQLLLDPLWSVIFPLPVLLGWLGNIPTEPLIGMALCSSVTFTAAHGKRDWYGRLLFCALGALLNWTAIVPITLSDRQGMYFPPLPYGSGLPPWVNASLWGLICAMSLHLACNIWLFIQQKPCQAAAPKARQ